MKIHPSDTLLEELLLSVPDESLLRHLTSCSRCRSRIEVQPGEATTSSEFKRSSSPIRVLTLSASKSVGSADLVDYGPALERSEQQYLERAHVIEQERRAAPTLVAELLAVRPEKRNLLLANSSRFQTWGVFEFLLERSWETRGISRSESEELAKLALSLSNRLDFSYYDQRLVEDLRARAWSYIANIRRMAADFAGAEEAFLTSYGHLKLGTREPLERALFLDLKASLQGALRQFDDANRLLRRAITIFLVHGDHHRAGKSLVNLAAVHSYAGKPDEAIKALRESLRLIDANQDERLLLCAWHNLIENLTSSGKYIEAQGLYRKARPLYRKYNDSGFPNRRLWVKGKIARGLGQDDSAEALFAASREGFLAEESPYEAALVSLELAILYAEQERTAELKQLAVEMLPIFASRHIHREAMAALMFLKQAVESERLSLEVVTGIADFLQRAKSDPDLQFKAPV